MADGMDLDFRICFTFNNAEFMRQIKFRAWNPNTNEMISWEQMGDDHWDLWTEFRVCKTMMQYTGLKDKNGKEIYEGDVLEFADKWEWYKTSYGIKMRFADPDRRKELQEQYDNEPMERRVIELPEDYEWLLSSEIQTYWHVIGNIWENPNLIIK